MMPEYSQKQGIFTINNNNVFIDLSGIIYFTKGIDVGIHSFIINYNLNNISNQTIYTLNVLPTISYTVNTIYLLYQRNSIDYSQQPIYNQLYGIFTIKDYIGDLILNNYVTIDISSGIITFNDLIDVNNYSFVIFYTLNNLENTTTYNLVVTPNINYSVSLLDIYYGDGGQSELPLVNPINGIFTIFDISGGFVIDQYLVTINKNTGLISVNTNTPVGSYQVIVLYKINKNSSSFIYNIIVRPTLVYKINTKNIDYGNFSTSIIPIYSPTRGDFLLIYDNTLSGKIIINQNNGQISFSNNIDVGNYIISIQYSINTNNDTIIITVNYYLTVNPILIYTNLIQTILYNHDIIYSELPIYYQKGGTFDIKDISNTLIQNNLVTIDTSGVLFFTNFIIIGNYDFLITYIVNNISTSTNYSLHVLPNISYFNNINQIMYKETYYSGIPYIDPSGGIFIFTDVSGAIIKDNLINVDNLTGLITLTNNINVGLYTFFVNYIINNVINSTIFVLNVIPFIEYNIGFGTKQYSSIKYSEIPFVDQAGGIFYTDNYEGITIDASNGVIKFNFDLDVNNYIFNIYYKLNGVTNKFVYTYLVYPLIDYDNLIINTIYDTSFNTNNAIVDPPGGYFYLSNSNTQIDISNTQIDINYIQIDISNIQIAQDTGIIYFDKNIKVGKYFINVNYVYNEIQNSVMLTYIMKPYILYPKGTLTTPYHDISFSELPIGLPLGGYFDATVPRISLIYTGISINNTTGLIRFGFINAGYWVLTCSYTYNNVTSTQYYYLIVLANIYYTPPYEIIPYNSIFTTSPPTIKNPGGQFSLVESLSSFIINKNTGALTFKNLNAGVYYKEISYIVFGGEIIINYTLGVKPTVNYIPNFIQTSYTNPVTSIYPFYAPLGGIFSIQNNDPNNPNLTKDISVDVSNGLIKTNSLLKVGLYNSLVNYIINDSTETIPFTISVYPTFIFPIGFLIVNYGSNYYSERAIVNPKRGIFTSINQYFSMDNSGGRIFISNTNSIGKYTLPIQYSFNKMNVIYNYNLIINPFLQYINTKYTSIYSFIFKSDQPIAKEYNGNFTIKLLDSTYPLGIGYNSTNTDIYDDYKLIFNQNTGILYFGKKISVGFYNFNINYAIMDLSSNVNFNYTVLPNVYYTPNILELGYQTVGSTKLPFRDQSGGYFNFSNTIEFINQIGKINLNNKTGIITFYKGIDIGFYNFKVSYTLNNISNIANYYLNVKPTYYYKNNTITLVYDTSGYSEFPVVITLGGIFSIYDTSLNNIFIDLYSGVIFINKLLIGSYTITLKYILNGSFTLTTYNIIIIPYINYSIGTKTLSYGNIGITEKPIGLELGGTWELYDLKDYDNQASKLTIDSSSGIVYFNSFINSGVYNTYIQYTVKNLSNIFNYILNIDPYLNYDLSGSINLFYNNPLLDISSNIIYKTIIPYFSPIGGTFYFKDNSNNFIQNNIQINKFTGQITIYNNPKVNLYLLNSQYFVKNLSIIYPININIYPNFTYSNKNIIIYYNTNNTFTNSSIPYYDPSGGIFKFVNPLDTNLFNKVQVKNNGQIIFNNNIIVDTYTMNINYIIPKLNVITTFNMSIFVYPTIIYNEYTLNLLYNTIGYSSVPTVIPFGGVFDISQNTYNQIININTGQLKFTNLNVGTYIFFINYVYNNVITNIIYTVNITSLIGYNPSIKIDNYSFGGFSSIPLVDLIGGLFTIPYDYSTYYITIDISSGIIKYTNKTPVFNYLIPVSYSINNLSKTINYNLIIKPYIYYDISSIILNYSDYYISNLPFVNPKDGLYSIIISKYDIITNKYDIITDKYDIITDNFNITSSGIITICGIIDPNNYIITSNYSYKNIISTYQIYLIIKPLFYYTKINNVIYQQNNYSVIPFVNPLNGTFTSLDTNIGIIDTNGIIYFNQQLFIGNYSLELLYSKNFIETNFTYNFTVLPYINYKINNTQHIGGTTFTTVSADILPYSTDGLYIEDRVSLQNNNGSLFFDSSLNIDVYNIIVTYYYNNFSNTFIYTHTVLPYIYYDNGIYNYGIVSYSPLPITNTDTAYFSIEFILNSYNQIKSITIDSSSGIIKFNDDMIIGVNSFYVIIYKNALINKHLYNFVIKPNLQYQSIYSLNYNETLIISPITYKPLYGIFSLYSNYNFISLINENTGEIKIKGTIIGKFNFNIVYNINDISNSLNIIVEIKPVIFYEQNYDFIYGTYNTTNSPIVSIGGGLYYIFQDISNIFLDNNTGIISVNNLQVSNYNLPVSNYNLRVYYNIYDVSSFTFVNIKIKPYISYLDDYYIEYGMIGFTNTPSFNPINGIFSLINNIDGITIDENNGSIYISSTVKKNDYILDVKYEYNNISNIVSSTVIVTSKIIELSFIIYDKIYNGNSELKVKSNKLIGVTNNDKVFVQSYNASFLSPDVALDSPVNVTDIILGGPDADNYYATPDLNTVGNINYLNYTPNIVKINKGTTGQSTTPNISDVIINPSFIIKEHIPGFTIDDFGVIYWDNTLEINTYNIQILIYDIQNSFTIPFTLIVTTNLYTVPLTIDLPIIQNYNFEYTTYQLRYTTISGFAYAIDSSLPSIIAKFDIKNYINQELNHDLGTFIPFTFELPNADPNTELILYELNDDDTINPKYQYNMIYIGNKLWTSNIRYLSDFFVQDINTKINTPPTILPITNVGNIFYYKVNISITGLPNSTIYYTLDGSEPTIDSELYTVPFLIKQSCTIKAISFTPNYLPSNISEVNYIIKPLPCILSNTLVKTVYGYEFVDNLNVNDIIITADGREVPILNILKHEIVNPKNNEFPVIIPKDFFGSELPNKDTYISETHAILVPNTKNEWIIPVDNLLLFQRKIVKIVYYNFELPNYFTDTLIVNNLPIESWSSSKYKFKYSGKIQKIINKKKMYTMNKYKLFTYK